MTVEPNTIYIMTFERNRRHQDINEQFHYSTVIGSETGTHRVMHAVNTYSGIWSFKSKDHNGIFESRKLASVTAIGNLSRSGKSVSDVESILSSIEHRTPRELGGRRLPYNCRVWVRVAIERLHNEGVISIDDFDALMEECHANGHQAIKDNKPLWAISAHAN
ncbi:hypothetical protein K474DRAFT_1708039 [Panus rudis PR-1116 ss-1]|nr:hypothetical protein K474DRAFT_1708039 [Panus rudis PR-1116 ss-1]